MTNRQKGATGDRRFTTSRSVLPAIFREYVPLLSRGRFVGVTVTTRNAFHAIEAIRTRESYRRVNDNFGYRKLNQRRS